MDNFSKVISFVLGLIVVVVLLVILTGRFNLRSKFLPLAGISKTSPTPTKTVAKNGTKTVTGTPNGTKGGTAVVTDTTDTYEYHAYKNSKVATQGAALASIPKTGAETALIPVALTTLLSGIYLRRKTNS